ncbi:response regulator [Candidatus Dependentiae bacterium]|nr:response regulator [Candidatus Dependentiae bacterium]
MEDKEQTVLFIDDDASIRKLISEILLSSGYSVICPEIITRESISAIASQNKFDLAILDIMMPEISGIEICSMLKNKTQNNLKYLPVIFLTANQTDDISDKCFEAGGDDFLLKPFKKKEFLYKIKSLLRIKKLNETITMQKFLRDKMMYTVVHELRAPLTSIITSNESMMVNLNNMEEDEKILYISAIAEESDRMMQIINKLLEIGKYDNDKIELILENTNVISMLTKVFASMKQPAEKKNITLKLDIPEFRLFIQCDKEKIEQVIYNLVSNAIKFTSPNGEIVIGANKENSNIKVYVRDTGLGIKEDEMSNLFNEFQQLSSRPTAGESSTGLGLAISRRIINAHKGKLGVESEWGKGSLFYFTLPV